MTPLVCHARLLILKGLQLFTTEPSAALDHCHDSNRPGSRELAAFMASEVVYAESPADLSCEIRPRLSKVSTTKPLVERKEKILEKAKRSIRRSRSGQVHGEKLPSTAMTAVNQDKKKRLLPGQLKVVTAVLHCLLDQVEPLGGSSPHSWQILVVSSDDLKVHLLEFAPELLSDAYGP